MAKRTKDWNKPHCESCGRQGDALGDNDGYTACCNELVCTGRRGHGFGTPENNVRTCCWAHAEAIFAERGEKVPEGSCRLD